jgi:outer membrane protease
MRRPAVFCLAAAFLLLTLSSTARAAGEKTFAFGLGSLQGDTTYHISAYDAAGSGIESELEFPLMTIMLGVEGGYVGRNEKGQEALRISLQWSVNVDNGSGLLKDSDWLTNDLDIQAPPSPPHPPNSGYPHPGLDIYSTSDIALKANIADLRASYNYWPSEGLAIGPLGGLLYQHFKFNASNVHQVGFGPYAADYTGNVSGLVLTYDVTYIIPYLGMHVEMPAGTHLQAFLDLGYSPRASAEDRDDHVLRKKVSRASTSGTAWLAALSAQWDLKDNDFFLLRGQYLRIDTSGTQTQTFSDGSGQVFTGINDRITSLQVSASISFSHRF